STRPSSVSATGSTSSVPSGAASAASGRRSVPTSATVTRSSHPSAGPLIAPRTPSDRRPHSRPIAGPAHAPARPPPARPTRAPARSHRHQALVGGDGEQAQGAPLPLAEHGPGVPPGEGERRPRVLVLDQAENGPAGLHRHRPVVGD